MDEQTERRRFVRWIKRNFPDVSTARHRKPDKDQYIVCAVQEAWQGWKARASFGK